MSTASAVPQTREELEGDEALETLRRAGRRRLVVDTVVRFRAADGFSHTRALAFQGVLTVLPAIIAVIGLAATMDSDELRRVVTATVDDLAPGPAGEVLTDALRDRRRSGTAALVGGLLGTIFGATTTMAQLERSANRIYGVERDRPFRRRYGTALVLGLLVTALVAAAVALLVAGSAIRRTAGWSDTLDTVWAVGRRPLGVLLVVAAVALLFEHAPHRRQPEASWLAVGAAAAGFLWLIFIALLDGYFDLSSSFGTTYGPIAGIIGVLLWGFFSALALLLGLAFAAQLEAVRAGVPHPRAQ